MLGLEDCERQLASAQAEVISNRDRERLSHGEALASMTAERSSLITEKLAMQRHHEGLRSDFDVAINGVRVELSTSHASCESLRYQLP